MTSNETSALSAFCLQAAGQILSTGQGYLDHAADSTQVQLAWFRETDHEWLLILAVETEQRRVETPPGTFLTIPDERGAEQDLAMQLLLMLSEMSGPTAV